MGRDVDATDCVDDDHNVTLPVARSAPTRHPASRRRRRLYTARRLGRF